MFLPVWHKVSRVQNDWGKHEKEEDVWSQRVGWMLGGQEEQESDDDSDNNQKT